MIDPTLPQETIYQLEELKHNKSNFTHTEYQENLFNLKLRLANSIQPKIESNEASLIFNKMLSKT